MKRYIQGFIIFLAAALLLGYVGFPLQAALGLPGLAMLVGVGCWILASRILTKR